MYLIFTYMHVQCVLIDQLLSITSTVSYSIYWTCVSGLC